MTHDTTDACIRHLRDVEGLTFAEIGKRLGITRQAAWQAYQRATRRATRPNQSRKPKRKPKKYQD